MKVNGKDKMLEKPVSVSDFLVSEGYRPEIVAVERNGEIIPKKNFSETMLENSDVIEVVSFMGGG